MAAVPSPKSQRISTRFEICATNSFRFRRSKCRARAPAGREEERAVLLGSGFGGYLSAFIVCDGPQAKQLSPNRRRKLLAPDAVAPAPINPFRAENLAIATELARINRRVLRNRRPNAAVSERVKVLTISANLDEFLQFGRRHQTTDRSETRTSAR